MTSLHTPIRRRWMRRIGITALVLGASTAAAIAPASAAPVASPAPRPAVTATDTVVLPSGTTTAQLGTGGVHATVVKAAAAAIDCTLQVNNPHMSSHNPGNVNVTSTITCTAPVDELSMYTALYFDGNLVVSNPFSNAGQSYLSGNAATACVPGTYEGGATGLVTFPPGYEPPTSDFGGEVWSPAVSITC